MTWTAPWHRRDLATCATHPGPRPFRVVAATLDERGRCAQCVRDDVTAAAVEPESEPVEAPALF